MNIDQIKLLSTMKNLKTNVVEKPQNKCDTGDASIEQSEKEFVEENEREE